MGTPDRTHNIRVAATASAASFSLYALAAFLLLDNTRDGILDAFGIASGSCGSAGLETVPALFPVFLSAAAWFVAKRLVRDPSRGLELALRLLWAVSVLIAVGAALIALVLSSGFGCIAD